MPTAKQNPQLQNYQEEDKLSVYQQDNDFIKFLDSLPREKGWYTPYSYQLKGFWHSPPALEGIVSFQRHLAQDSDILLATLPKCGTTWLQALVFTLLNRNKHSPVSQEHPLLTKNPHDLVPYLEKHLYSRNKTPDFSSWTTPRLFATHSPFGLLPTSVLESKCKLVYLCRNLKDTFISLWHFAQNLRAKSNEGIASIEEAVDMFCKGTNLNGPFWDHVLDYWKASLENPEKIFFLTYEELQKEPIHVVRHLADFLGYSFSAEEEDSGMVEAIVKLCSFESLSEMNVNKNDNLSANGFACKMFFRKGVVGDWKNHLTVEMAHRMDAVVEEKLQGSGLLELKAATFANKNES